MDEKEKKAIMESSEFREFTKFSRGLITDHDHATLTALVDLVLDILKQIDPENADRITEEFKKQCVANRGKSQEFYLDAYLKFMKVIEREPLGKMQQQSGEAEE